MKLSDLSTLLRALVPSTIPDGYRGDIFVLDESIRKEVNTRARVDEAHFLESLVAHYHDLAYPVSTNHPSKLLTRGATVLNTIIGHFRAHQAPSIALISENPTTVSHYASQGLVPLNYSEALRIILDGNLLSQYPIVMAPEIAPAVHRRMAEKLVYPHYNYQKALQDVLEQLQTGLTTIATIKNSKDESGETLLLLEKGKKLFRDHINFGRPPQFLALSIDTYIDAFHSAHTTWGKHESLEGIFHGLGQIKVYEQYRKTPLDIDQHSQYPLTQLLIHIEQATTNDLFEFNEECHSNPDHRDKLGFLSGYMMKLYRDMKTAKFECAAESAVEKKIAQDNAPITFAKFVRHFILERPDYQKTGAAIIERISGKSFFDYYPLLSGDIPDEQRVRKHMLRLQIEHLAYEEMAIAEILDDPQFWATAPSGKIVDIPGRFVNNMAELIGKVYTFFPHIVVCKDTLLTQCTEMLYPELKNVPQNQQVPYRDPNPNHFFTVIESPLDMDVFRHISYSQLEKSTREIDLDKANQLTISSENICQILEYPGVNLNDTEKELCEFFYQVQKLVWSHKRRGSTPNIIHTLETVGRDMLYGNGSLTTVVSTLDPRLYQELTARKAEYERYKSIVSMYRCFRSAMNRLDRDVRREIHLLQEPRNNISLHDSEGVWSSALHHYKPIDGMSSSIREYNERIRKIETMISFHQQYIQKSQHHFAQLPSQLQERIPLFGRLLEEMNSSTLDYKTLEEGEPND